MRRISIGSWAYTIGPYADSPVDFDTVITKLRELGFDGVELGGFPPHPNPDDCASGDERARVVEGMNERGLVFSGLAANLWSQHLVDTDDHGGLVEEASRIPGAAPHRHLGASIDGALDEPRDPLHARLAPPRGET